MAAEPAEVLHHLVGLVGRGMLPQLRQPRMLAAHVHGSHGDIVQHLWFQDIGKPTILGGGESARRGSHPFQLATWVEVTIRCPCAPMFAGRELHTSRDVSSQHISCRIQKAPGRCGEAKLRQTLHQDQPLRHVSLSIVHARSTVRMKHAVHLTVLRIFA